MITLDDEQARLLTEVVAAGGANSPEEAVDMAVKALYSSATSGKPVCHRVDNLADLFANSPFRGLEMDFARDEGAGQDMEL